MSLLKVNNIADLGDDAIVTSGVLDTLAVPAGGILQVVSSAKTNTYANSTSSFTDIDDLSVTITPTSSSSKIMVFVDLKLASDSSAGYPQVRMMRDSTQIYLGDSSGSSSRVSWGTYGTDATALALGKHGANFSVALNFLDSPATTSPIEYKVQARGRATLSKFLYINRGYNPSDTADSSVSASSITIMEVAG